VKLCRMLGHLLMFIYKISDFYYLFTIFKNLL